jgi:hypothetical protein
MITAGLPVPLILWSPAGTALPKPMVDERGPKPGPLGGIRSYYRALWSGTEPLHRVIISDLLIGGTLINVVAMALAFALFGLEAPAWLATTVFFAPIPYNVFLVFVVWKTTATSDSIWTWPARALSFAWFAAMLLI